MNLVTVVTPMPTTRQLFIADAMLQKYEIAYGASCFRQMVPPLHAF
jgi:hypothetical protein